MNRLMVKLFVVFFCVVFFVGITVADEVQFSPSQKRFLDQRTKPEIMIGSFSSCSSLLYAILGVTIHTDSLEVAGAQIKSTFPEDYKPTWREVFDSLAKQTDSTWSYDSSRRVWLFSKPPLPFAIDLAAGWVADPRNGYVSYRPTIAPVGMDIYMLGQVQSGENPKMAQKKFALQFGKHFKQDVTTAEMSLVNLPGGEALFFSTTAASTGIHWRQWVFVELDQVFAIVSAIKPEHEKQILPDVQAMVKSFKVKPRN